MPLDPGAAGGQEVVGVHRTVHQGVPHAAKSRVTATLCQDHDGDGHINTSCDVTCKLRSEPRHERQRAVVDYMERGQMVKLFAEDEENRVEEVNKL